MTLWALASIDHCPTELLQRLPGRLRGNERALGPQGLPNVLWALAKFEGSPAVEMVQELQVRRDPTTSPAMVHRCPAEPTTRCLETLVQPLPGPGFLTPESSRDLVLPDLVHCGLRPANAHLFSCINLCTNSQIQHAMCKEITIPRRPIRHVCACFDVKGDPSLLGSPVTPTQAAAAQVAGQMTPQGVANTAFALARLQAPRAEHVVADLLRPDVLRSMTWHDVGDVLWAVGTLGLEDRGQAADHLAQRVLQVVKGTLECPLPCLSALPPCV